MLERSEASTTAANLSSRQSKATRDLNKTYTEIPHTRLTLAPTGVDLRFGMTKQRFVIGEFISVTMNSPMLFCFVIDEFCSNRSNVALPPLRQ